MEYFNGLMSGIQMAKCELGMYYVSLDNPETVIEAIIEYMNAKGESVTEILHDFHKLAEKWWFKWIAKKVMMFLGSQVAMISETLIQTGRAIGTSGIGTMINSVISTAMSNIAGKIVSNIYNRIYESIANCQWTTARDNWASATTGDGMNQQRKNWIARKLRYALYFLGFKRITPYITTQPSPLADQGLDENEPVVEDPVACYDWNYITYYLTEDDLRLFTNGKNIDLIGTMGITTYLSIIIKRKISPYKEEYYDQTGD